MTEENDHYLHPMITDHDVISSKTYKSKEPSGNYYADAIFLLHNGYVSNSGMTVEELSEQLRLKDEEKSNEDTKGSH